MDEDLLTHKPLDRSTSSRQRESANSRLDFEFIDTKWNHAQFQGTNKKRNRRRRTISFDRFITLGLSKALWIIVLLEIYVIQLTLVHLSIWFGSVEWKEKGREKERRREILSVLCAIIISTWVFRYNFHTEKTLEPIINHRLMFMSRGVGAESITWHLSFSRLLAHTTIPSYTTSTFINSVKTFSTKRRTKNYCCRGLFCN